MKLYIIFGDTRRSDGDNIEGIFFSKKKAEEYKKQLDQLKLIDYTIEEIETDDEP